MNKHSQLALSLAITLSLLGAVATAAQAADAHDGLFQVKEVSAPLLAAGGGDHKCGAGTCGAKDSSSKCGSKKDSKAAGGKSVSSKCGSNKGGNSKCGSAKAAGSKCGSHKGKDSKCGAGTCGSK